MKMVRELAKLFGENDIRMLAIKGPLLALRLYGNVSLRISGDLDLLIDPHDKDRGVELLLKHGYTYPEFITTPKRIRTYRKRQRIHYGFIHPENGLHVELHWCLETWQDLDFERLWQNHRSVSLMGKEISTPKDSEQFFALCLHGLRHGFYKMKWMADLINYLPLLTTTDRREINVLFMQYQLQDTAALINKLINQLNFSRNSEPLPFVPFRNEKNEKIGLEMISMIFQRFNACDDDFIKNQKRYQQLFRTFLPADGKKRFKEAVRNGFIRALPNEREYKKLNLPDSLHFLYYPCRWWILKEKLMVRNTEEERSVNGANQCQTDK